MRAVELKPGTRLYSAVCSTMVVVIQSPSSPVELECGGALMVLAGDVMASRAVDPAHADGTLLGKRYVLDDAGLEVLCTKDGKGSLSADGVILRQKDAKALPSSD